MVSLFEKKFVSLYNEKDLSRNPLQSYEFFSKHQVNDVKQHSFISQSLGNSKVTLQTPASGFCDTLFLQIQNIVNTCIR